VATEVGSAYVTLIPSAKGFASKMQKELASEVAKAAKGVGEDLGEEIGEPAAEEAAKTFGSDFKKGLAKIGGLVAVGAALAKGLTGAMDASALTGKLQAQLGLTEKQSAQAGKVAGELFGSNYGDSMEQVNEAIGFVIRDIDGMRGASESALERISTKALNTATIFDQDLGATTRAVSQMMRTGMATDADHAFDILTRGFQSGADKSEDFLDTLNEYGTQFRKIGIDGETATGLITQGLQAGARDGDKVADAIKEFSIRAVDGSKASAEGFSTLGLSAEKMTNQIAKGGKPAAAGLQTVLDKLRGIKDPVEREAAAVKLFGTQAEDLGQALYALDPSKAAEGLGKVGGAAEEANKKFNATPAAKLQAFTRQLQQGLTEAMASYVIPALMTLAPLLEKLGPIFDAVGAAIGAVVGFFKEHSTLAKILAGVLGTLVTVTAAHAAVVAVSSGALKKWLLQSKLVQAFTKTWAAVQWALNAAMSANPIVLVVLAVAALIAIIVLVIKKFGLWDAIVAKLGAAWEWFKGVMVAVWDAVKSAVIGGVEATVGFIKALPGKAMGALRSLGTALKNVVTGAWNLVKNVTTRLVVGYITFYAKLPGRILSAVKSLGGLLGKFFTSVWNNAKQIVARGAGAVVDLIRSMPGKIGALAGKFLSAAKTLGSKIIDGIKSGLSAVGGIAGDIASGVKSALTSVINGAIDAMNRAIPNKLGWGKFAIDISDNPIPHVALASGGRVTGATVALIGEGREPETVLPDSMLRGLLERVSSAGAAGAGQVAELRITNWEDGTGFFRLVANDAVNTDARFRRQLGAMHA